MQKHITLSVIHKLLMASSKRNELDLKQKVELIGNSSGQSHRQLAEKFNIGRTQGSSILNQLGYTNFWMQTKNTLRIPLLWQRTKRLILPFPTSYLVEKGFSSVMRLHSKQRNRLQITKSGDLRLMLTKFEPNVVKLVGENQCQGSH